MIPACCDRPIMVMRRMDALDYLDDFTICVLCSLLCASSGICVS